VSRARVVALERVVGPRAVGMRRGSIQPASGVLDREVVLERPAAAPARRSWRRLPRPAGGCACIPRPGPPCRRRWSQEGNLVHLRADCPATPSGAPAAALTRSGSCCTRGVVTRKVILGTAADDGLAPTRPDTKKAPSGLNSLGVHGPRRTSMWWSRGESNPRPQAIPGQIYTLSSLIWISRRRRAGARYGQRQSLDLVQSRVTQLRTSRCA
jgi:hypothetical protein